MLVVNTAADSYDLTVLSTVKAELSIEGGASDAQLTEQIHQASDICATYCSRVFADETVTETLRNVRRTVIGLQRGPATTITSVTEDGTALLATEYEAETDDKGLSYLYRLSDDDRVDWDAAKLVIVYTGGYALLDGLPRTIERACIDLVKLLYFSASRDPVLRSVDVPGVMSKTYWVGATSDGALPPHIEANLAPFRRVDGFSDD